MASSLRASPSAAQEDPPRQERAAQASGPLLGVLVPLTGERAPVGQSALRQVMMAHHVFGGRVEAFDTAQGLDSAWEAARAAGVVAVLGPLGDSETAQLQGQWQPGDPAILSMTATRGLENPDRRLLRMRTSVADQARALAIGVPQEVPGERIAVLSPNDGYGLEATLAFVDAAVDVGWLVPQVVFYDAEQPDGQRAAEHLVGRRRLRLAAPGGGGAAPRTREVVHNGTIDAPPDWLFIPEYGATVADLLPFVQFQGWISDRALHTVGLLGTSGWLAESLAWVGDLAVGARIIAVYHPDDPSDRAVAYTEEHRLRYGRDPSEFDAQVFDAAAFAILRLRALAADADVDAAWDSLRNGRPHDGVAGRMWIAPTGGVVRDLTLWEVDASGRFFPLELVRATDPAATP